MTPSKEQESFGLVVERHKGSASENLSTISKIG